jgi:4-amino-4-deoxy-L-arabinose transferase-like glycosyltransferase
MPIRDSRESLNDILAGVGMGLFVFALYLLPSQWRPLTETAEARIAVTARNMLESGDWVVPKINEEARLEKPPLPYWLVAISAQILGPEILGDGEDDYRLVSVRAAVLPSAIFGAGCVFLLVLFGAHLHGRSTGILAGLILGLSFLFTRFSQYGTGEIILTFFTTASLLSAAWLVCSPRPGIVPAIL